VLVPPWFPWEALASLVWVLLCAVCDRVRGVSVNGGGVWTSPVDVTSMLYPCASTPYDMVQLAGGNKVQVGET
jgi:hypothetical protein